jgi:hypothetical protein
VAWWAARLERVAIWLDPPRRRRLLSVAAMVVLVAEVADEDATGLSPVWRVAVVAPALLGLAGLGYLAASRFARLPRFVRRRPQVVLHAGFWALLAGLWLAPAGGGTGRQTVALFALMVPFLLWRLGYLLKSGQRGKAAGSAPGDHLFYLWPLWGGSETPYGKGLDYLARCEARSAEALARSQLGGLWLLLLAVLWSGAMRLMSGLVYGEPKGFLHAWSLGVPRLENLIGRRAAAPLPIAWLSLYCDLVWSTLKIAAKGHVYVGVLRLLGFNALRNTDRPLLAESVVEFWNRYYYYFKELLVEFFFYPTYARLRGAPWFRTLGAVFAAAFVGNLYYHFVQQKGALVAGDPAAAWAAIHSRVLYCFLLASGVYVSMLREQRRRGRAAAAAGSGRRLARLAGVWTFFALIHIWAVGRQYPTFGQRTAFFLSLFAWW